jgi:hypothetical protein
MSCTLGFLLHFRNVLPTKEKKDAKRAPQEDKGHVQHDGGNEAALMDHGVMNLLKP